MLSPVNPVFFPGPTDFRHWLAEHSTTAAEVWVGFYKKGSGLPSLTWPEAVDQALCFGWIDGIRKGLAADSYTIRFTPRKQDSTWSSVNLNRVAELTELGLMQPAGLKAFEHRQEKRSGIYSYEQTEVARLTEEEEQQFQANLAAWQFFQAQGPGYQKTKYWWIINAKKFETRRNRLAALIEACTQGRRI